MRIGIVRKIMSVVLLMSVFLIVFILFAVASRSEAVDGDVIFMTEYIESDTDVKSVVGELTYPYMVKKSKWDDGDRYIIETNRGVFMMYFVGEDVTGIKRRDEIGAWDDVYR